MSGAAAAIGMAGMAYLSYLGQQEANQTNMWLGREANEAAQARAREQMGFQREMVQQQREYETQMSSSAHQREVADLKAAGLNPILSAKGAGASTPSTSAPAGAAGAVSAPTVQNQYVALATAAKQLTDLYMDTRRQDAEFALMDAQKKKVGAEIEKLGVDTQVSRKDIPKSEVTNELYDLVRPAIKKLREFVGGSAKKLEVQDPQRDKRQKEMMEGLKYYRGGF